MCKDPVAALKQSQNKHVSGVQKVRGSTASLEREAGVRRCEEYSPSQSTGKESTQQLLLLPKCGKMGRHSQGPVHRQLFLWRNKQVITNVIALYLLLKLQWSLQPCSTEKGLLLSTSNQTWVQFAALPLPWCITLISSPNLCFSFLKFQMEKCYYLPHRFTHLYM